MCRIRYLVVVGLSVLAAAVPLGSRPLRANPTLVLPRFLFVPPVPGDCSDERVRTCGEAEMHLSLLKQKVQGDIASPDESHYTIQDSDEDFEGEEEQLKNEWETKGGDSSLRPYIIEAKVTHASPDEYYIAFRCRLVGESRWLHLRGYSAKTTTLVDLPKKFFVGARQALASLCRDVVADWEAAR